MGLGVCPSRGFSGNRASFCTIDLMGNRVFTLIAGTRDPGSMTEEEEREGSWTHRLYDAEGGSRKGVAPTTNNTPPPVFVFTWCHSRIFCIRVAAIRPPRLVFARWGRVDPPSSTPPQQSPPRFLVFRHEKGRGLTTGRDLWRNQTFKGPLNPREAQGAPSPILGRSCGHGSRSMSIAASSRETRWVWDRICSATPLTNSFG